MRKLLYVATLALVVAMAVSACSPGSATANKGNAPESESPSRASASGSSNASKSYTDGWGLLSDDFLDEFAQRFDQVESEVVVELKDRRTAQSKCHGIGEEAKITGSLAVRIDAVENGPYDYADRTPTVKVTTTMRNLTDHTIWVKSSNFDADSIDGRRLDHKIYIKGSDGNRDVRSFYPTKISPGASYTGEVYFDGEGLKSVIYIPHFVISSESQYVYFDLE